MVQRTDRAAVAAGADHRGNSSAERQSQDVRRHSQDRPAGADQDRGGKAESARFHQGDAARVVQDQTAHPGHDGQVVGRSQGAQVGRDAARSPLVAHRAHVPLAAFQTQLAAQPTGVGPEQLWHRHRHRRSERRYG